MGGDIHISNLTNKAVCRRNEILHTSQELFNQNGFQDTSISDIMKKVGAAKGSFYYYFETKEQVLDALVDQNTDDIVNAMLPILDDTSMHALDKLKLMLREEIKINLRQFNQSNHLHNIANVDMHQKILIAMVKKVSIVMSQVIEQGIHEGIFQVRQPLAVSQLLITGIHFILDTGIFNWTKEQYFEKIKAAEELIEKALCIENGSFGFLLDFLYDFTEGDEHNEYQPQNNSEI